MPALLIVVNLLLAQPAAFAPLVRGKLDTRVPPVAFLATMLPSTLATTQVADLPTVLALPGLKANLLFLVAAMDRIAHGLQHAFLPVKVVQVVESLTGAVLLLTVPDLIKHLRLLPATATFNPRRKEKVPLVLILRKAPSVGTPCELINVLWIARLFPHPPLQPPTLSLLEQSHVLLMINALAEQLRHLTVGLQIVNGPTAELTSCLRAEV